MRTKRKKRTSLIVILLLLILLISVGYAALSSELSITTNATIKKQNWDVHFENVQVKEGSVTATTAATIDEATRTNVTYAVAMNTPGDFYEFTVDVVNAGGIDAMVETIANTTLTAEQLKYLDYSVTYSDGAEIKQYDKLAVGATETLKVNLTYKKDINVEDLPTEDDTIELKTEATYVQADSNAKDREKVETGTKIGTLKVGDYVSIGGNNLLNDDEVFYQEGENRAEWKVAKIDETNNTVTLILSDYLPTAKITNAASMNMKLNANGYTLGWDNTKTDRDGAVATLTNPANWSHLLAESKIASVTITGGLTKEDVDNIVDINTIVPHNSKFNGCSGYWLASAGGYGDTGVWAVKYSGGVVGNYLDVNNYYGVCLAVSLSSNILVEQIGENAWSIK